MAAYQRPGFIRPNGRPYVVAPTARGRALGAAPAIAGPQRPYILPGRAGLMPNSRYRINPRLLPRG
jgi:hypothetical protein